MAIIPLLKLVQMLLQTVDVSERLVAALGHTAERQTDQYRFTPNDPRFSDGLLGFEVDPLSGLDHPFYVELIVASSHHMSVEELTSLFGAWERGTPAPEGNPYVINYYYDDNAYPFTAYIRALLSGEPDEPSSTVREILMRRDERS